MFFFLSKVFYALLMPLTWVTLCLVGALIFRKRKFSRRLIIAALAMVLIFGNEFIVNEIYLIWEEAPPLFKDIEEHYDIAIILGGVSKPNKEPTDRVHFDRGADRVVHPLFLYKMGKIDKFLVSGGTGRLVYARNAEGPSLAKALRVFGVPEKDIIIEASSRNTRENAVFSKRIIDSLYKNQTPNILMVTSAFHMPRSKRCFAKVNLEVDYLTTDFLAHSREFGIDTLLIPNVDAMMKWGKLFKEWAGLIAYKFAGYI